MAIRARRGIDVAQFELAIHMGLQMVLRKRRQECREPRKPE